MAILIGCYHSKSLYAVLLQEAHVCILDKFRLIPADSNRLNLQQHNLVKITGAVCLVAYIATIIVFLTHCHPIYRLWQIYPYPGDDCALNISKYVALVVTNVTWVALEMSLSTSVPYLQSSSTDLMILYIPLPLLWNVRLPLRRKLLYGVWLCTGVFMMTATLLRCILCLQDVSQINVGTIWSIRETVSLSNFKATRTLLMFAIVCRNLSCQRTYPQALSQ